MENNQLNGQYGNIKGFLKSSDDLKLLSQYDFKNEYKNYSKNKNVEDLKTIDNNLEKIIQYKKNNTLINPKFDCDGSGCGNSKFICTLAREVYRTLWGWNDKKDNNQCKELSRYGFSIFDNGASMGPETINSFMTTFNIRGEVSADCFNDFAKYTHCIGNFTLTYEGYNRYIFKDYWDLKLANQYQNKTTFNNYINTFFLWDYVFNCDENDSKKIYKIKSLFKENFRDSSSFRYLFSGKLRNKGNKYLPQGQEINIFLTNVVWAIKRRGVFMVAMLKIAAKDIDLYKDIQLTVFNTNKVYSDFDEVFLEILKLDDIINNNEIKELLEQAQEEIDKIKVV